MRLLILLLLACTTPTSSAVAALQSPAVEWARHTIHAGPLGADGTAVADVDGDGDLDVATPWEQSGTVTLSLQPADPTAPWPTVTVGSNLGGVEAAEFADVDGDGRLDIVSACDACGRVVVHYAPHVADLLTPAAWTSVRLLAAPAGQRYMALAFADVDGDGMRDIVAGPRAGNPAQIGWLSSPTPRDGATWTWTPIGPVGWTMSLIARDVDGDGDPDLLLSDRTWYPNPDGTRNHSLKGTRWLENTGAGWTNRPIGYNNTVEAKMLADGGSYILDGGSVPGTSAMVVRAGWNGWAGTTIPQPANVGLYHASAVGDVDLDGRADLVVSYSDAGTTSGVVWLRAPTWTRYEVSGPAGTKFDNVVLADLDRDGDLDVITSEQVEQLGVVWYENPAL